MGSAQQRCSRRNAARTQLRRDVALPRRRLPLLRRDGHAGEAVESRQQEAEGDAFRAFRIHHLARRQRPILVLRL